MANGKHSGCEKVPVQVSTEAGCMGLKPVYKLVYRHKVVEGRR